MSIIEVTRDLTGVHRHRWRFWVDQSHRNIDIVLSAFAVETRPSTRHKFRSDHGTRYESMDRRNGKLSSFDVPMPNDVLWEAWGKAVSMVRIVHQLQDGMRVAYPMGEKPCPPSS
jgi:hypothetical protein